jgi:ubiquinone/menaquinone biosynthesis C-methylase UbiE
MPTTPRKDEVLETAFRTWDNALEALVDIERRIHDGVPLDQLHTRAATYVDTQAGLFPWAMPAPGGDVLEIGSGVGYVMQAALRRFKPHRLIGLDVAPAMLKQAQARLARDGAADPRMEFLLYDGISVPLADASLDYIYSVAALQHVPKAYVYNLFLEIRRLLKPGGSCALQFLSFSHLKHHVRHVPFREEMAAQIHGNVQHWHFFYSFDELFHVLTEGVDARRIHIVDGEVSIWCSFGATGSQLHDPQLIELTHLRSRSRAAVPLKSR